MILLGKNTPFSKNPVLHPNKNVLYFKRREEEIFKSIKKGLRLSRELDT